MIRSEVEGAGGVLDVDHAGIHRNLGVLVGDDSGDLVLCRENVVPSLEAGHEHLLRNAMSAVAKAVAVCGRRRGVGGKEAADIRRLARKAGCGRNALVLKAGRREGHAGGPVWSDNALEVLVPDASGTANHLKRKNKVWKLA
eukprot:scaffold94231_cov28-Tisochrysis_lutea.AAC.3